MKRVEKWTILLCFLITGIHQTHASEVAFIGLTGDGAPAIEKTYDRTLRERLATNQQFRVADYLTIKNYKDRIDFHRYPVVSRNLLAALGRVAHDSTIFIWGSVNEYRISPVRRNLIGSFIDATLTIHLNIYSLSNQKIVFSGDVRVNSDKYKGINVFRPVEQVVHISAVDRTDLLNKLVREAVKKSEMIISVVLRGDLEKMKTVASQEEQRLIPSLHDVFSVPSMEGSSVGQGIPEE